MNALRHMHPLVRALAFAAIFTAAVFTVQFMYAVLVQHEAFEVDWKTLGLAAGVSFVCDVSRSYVSRR